MAKGDDEDVEHVESESKVVPLRPKPSKPPAPERGVENRLDEMRRILLESERHDDDELSDERVMENERAFKRRFGFLWPPSQRRALIELKRKLELTDSEVKLLRWSGVLKRTPLGVTLTSGTWLALWGGVILIYLGLLFAAVFVAAWPALESGATISPRVGVATALLTAFFYLVWWFHIEPWRIKRRVDRQLG